MPASHNRAAYEAALSRASRSLRAAMYAAEAARDEGSREDCFRLLAEISRLMSASLDQGCGHTNPMNLRGRLKEC
jgi:hypothetical protein